MTKLDLAAGVSRLQAVRQLADAFRARMASEDAEALLSLAAFSDSFGLEGDGAAFIASPEIRREALKILGLVKAQKGRGGPARFIDAVDYANRAIGGARSIWEELATQESLSSERVLELAGSAEAANAASLLLKELDLAAGVQRRGGLRRADLAQDELTEKRRAAEELENKKREAESSSDSLEKDFYPAFQEFLAQDYDHSVVAGGRRRFKGEWSTPDLIAVSATRSPIFGRVVRVTTVEVKLALSRMAIAEARAHRRFAHYSYVGVPVQSSELDAELLTDLVAAGVGLICYRPGGSVLHEFVEPVFHRPDEEDVDLLIAAYDQRALPGQRLTDVMIRHLGNA